MRSREDRKGAFYVARIERRAGRRRGRRRRSCPRSIRKFPWPKSMRWGRGSCAGSGRCNRSSSPFDGEVVPLEIDGVAGGDTTRGHRFMAPRADQGRGASRTISRSCATPGHARSAERRAATIRAEARDARLRQGSVVEDEACSTKSAGLVEWPVRADRARSTPSSWTCRRR